MKNNKELFNYILAIIGGILVGVGEAWVLIPLKLTTGGFNGIAMLIYYLLKLPVGFVSMLLNFPLFILSLNTLGRNYSIRTLVSMLVTSIMLEISNGWEPLTNDLLLASIFGSLIIGIGIAVCLKGSSTTGGTDLLAKIIQSKKKHLNLGNIILIIDTIIIAIASFTFESIEIALYSGIAVFVMTKVIDFILDGGKYEKALFIITNKSNEISEYIMNEIKRGVTKIDAIGEYTGDRKEILLCIANKREVPKIKDEIKIIDNRSFTIITTVTEAIGEGFEKE
ncbi:MAG: YitT family protein [Clostridia bacterium]|nr:YitT family protein [Clostridia bacterium]